MRRPTFCSDVHTVDDTYLNASQSALPADKEGRLSRVKRMLADSLLLGRRATASSCSRQFGIPLDEVALTKEGVPVVISKICSYLENHGLQCDGLFLSSAANPKLAERLRSTLDLDSANDVFTTALLLKLWLKELPEPIIWGHVATELITTHGKVSGESVGTWRQAIRLVLCTLPETNLRLLRFILRFLHRYNHHQQQRSSRTGVNSMVNHLGTVFAPLLILKGLEYYGAEQLSRANNLTSRLIQDHASIFHQWLLDHPSEDSPKSRNTSPSSSRKKHNHGGSVQKAFQNTENSISSQHRKRKERNESANSNQSLERKVIRSSSEERHVEIAAAANKKESIRRVSSHEDFSHAKHQVKLSTANRFTTVVELSDQPQTVHSSGLPLQECNHMEASVQTKDVQHTIHESYMQQKENELLKDQHQSLKTRDRPFLDSPEDEHERRRSSERVSRSLVPPRSVARRNLGRKKRAHQSNNSSVVTSEGESIDVPSTEEKEDIELPMISHNAPSTSAAQYTINLQHQYLLSPEDRDDDVEPEAEVESLSDESRPGSSHSFLQLHPPERERSPSPSVSPCTPPLDLTTLHQSVDGSEPVASRVGWDFIRPQHQEEEAGRGILLSPRNSMILTRRVFLDHNVPPSPPGDHHGSCLPGPTLDIENLIKKLNKQITSIKKKLKKYEEGFEREFGYRPSQSDKMANKDIKKMCLDLSRLRKELKEIKENPLSAMASQAEQTALRLGLPNETDSSIPALTSGNFSCISIEDTVTEVERRLKDKRRSAGRPESLDDMTPEQHAAEKVAMQKALLMLEKVCGRAASKQDRETVRPLYDRYRLLKRTVARATSSKLKDSINELATIHEHEAMDFTATADGGMDLQSQSSTQGSMGALTNSSSSFGVTSNTGSALLQSQPSVEETSDSQTSSSDSIGENLHALPLSDLVLQLTQTREEKKKLRRLLREQEEHFQQQTGRRMQREDRTSVSGDLVSKDYGFMYSSYKQVKAKLRLLEALVAKQR